MTLVHGRQQPNVLRRTCMLVILAECTLVNRARVVFTMAIDGRSYVRRGTGFDTWLPASASQ